MVAVDDGSTPADSAAMRAGVDAAEAALRAAGTPHAFRFVRAPRNGGKGSAIRLGWRHAHVAADWLGWVDADGAISADELMRLIGVACDAPDTDVVAGARVKMAGMRVERRVFRHLQGRVFATLTELVLGLGVYDTQCGIKLLRADRLRPLLPQLREDGWMLDVVLFALLRARGARVLEVPIDWTDAGTSKVQFGVDPLRMLWALLRIRSRVR
jgi:glycosyltransferase involved in cell wall biosynthesis